MPRTASTNQTRPRPTRAPRRPTAKATGTTPATTPRARSRRSPYLAPGLHIAPFLSREGRLVIVAISSHREFQGAAELTQCSGVITPEGYSAQTVAWLLMPELKQDGYLPFLNPGNMGPGRAALDRMFWARGVHVAPWRTSAGTGKHFRPTTTLIAVDSRHRFIQQIAMPPGADMEAAKRALESTLEPAEAEAAS